MYIYMYIYIDISFYISIYVYICLYLQVCLSGRSQALQVAEDVPGAAPGTCPPSTGAVRL